MTLTHVAHLLGGPRDGAILGLPDEGGQGPSLVLVMIALEIDLSRLEQPEPGAIPVETTRVMYLRSRTADPDRSTTGENHWKYTYVPDQPAKTAHAAEETR